METPRSCMVLLCVETSGSLSGQTRTSRSSAMYVDGPSCRLIRTSLGEQAQASRSGLERPTTARPRSRWADGAASGVSPSGLIHGPQTNRDGRGTPGDNGPSLTSCTAAAQERVSCGAALVVVDDIQEYHFWECRGFLYANA
mmetsp:Transcript_60137/g.160023  ORF Transcript_60137/g.160023 Transcript_60137/m.160023 type:complete len:142 (-) Transcript_60137:2-427(-)